MVNDKQIIISMTSYPARIHCVKQVFDSILIQNINRDIYKCVLVLSETEFLNRENDLPKDLLNMINNGDIELIWHPRNIMSHKKLIPTLLKYPDNPILIIDDDICREEGWLQMFIDDHKKYPNDIIVGTFMYHLNDEFKFNRFDGLKGVNCGTMQNIPNMIFDFARPANGAGGVLYPPNTFTDKRFFDEDKFMELTPTSDESWQYLFNILEDRTLRQSSKIFDNSKGVIRGTQGKINCLYKRNNYNEIFKKLFENFPEFEHKLYERQNNKVILSLTSYGERLKNKITDIVINSLLNQTHKPYKICLTLYQGDLQYMSDNLKQLVDNNIIELIISSEDIGPHKKYFYVMQKYRNYPIITFDDDIIYDSDVVESLVRSYKKHPNCISARRVHMITYNNKGCINKYKQWRYEYKYETSPNKDLFATGGGGTLYPPDILNINDRLLSQIYNMWHVDDIFLKYVELQKGINVVWVKNDRVMCEPIKNEITISTALYKINCTKNNNDNYIHMLNSNYSNIIVSITSWKPRLPYIDKSINSILNGTIKPCKIVLTLYKDDIQYIPNKLQKLIDANIVELIVCDDDLGAAKKWYYVIQKYPNNPIVLIDDDIEYNSDLLEKLLLYSEKYPNTIIANWGRPIYLQSKYNVMDFNVVRNWYLTYNQDIEPSYYMHFMSGAGTLLPSNSININDCDLNDIIKYKNIEEVYLKYLTLKTNTKVKVVPCSKYNNLFKPIVNDEIISSALWKINSISQDMNNNVGYDNLLTPEFQRLKSNTLNNKLLTIVIPIYNPNIELFDRCMNSIITQSIGLDKLDVILVNDNSSNINTINYIKDKYLCNPNIEMIDLEINMGPGNARNIGLNRCNTKYITFMDYDDWYYNDNILATILQHLEFNPNADMLCGARTNNGCEKITYSNINEDALLLINNYEDKLPLYQANLVSPQNKVYKVSFLRNNNLQYSNYRAAQDRLFFYNSVLAANNIILYNAPIFNYYKRTNKDLNNISNTFTYDTLIGNINVDLKLIDLFDKYDGEHAYLACNDILNVVNRYNKTDKQLFTTEQNNNITSTFEKIYEHFIKNVSKYNKDTQNQILNFYDKHFKNENTTESIDIVLTYVTCKDKKWLNEYNKYKSDVSKSRYDDLGTLKYWLKYVDNNMGWVNKIYIVVSNIEQIPDWVYKNNKVVVILHRDIIPSEYLPLFSSCAIEMFLHKIPNLSEKFIYFNDDIFVTKKCEKNDFFIDGKPVLMFEEKKSMDDKSFFSKQMLYNSQFIYGDNIEIYYAYSHGATPRLKSMDSEFYNENEEKILKQIYRFRKEKQLNQYVFTNNYIKQNYYVKNSNITKYISINEENLKYILLSIKLPTTKLLCLNDVIENSSETRELIVNEILNTFEKKFE